VSRGAPLLLVLLLVLAGCGGGHEHGTATLWVTRDRGAQVIYSGTVPAGLTAMQALDRRLDISTRYGGRFVQSIGGVQGSVTSRHDWFYFMNGVEGDRSAAEVKLRPGDIEWWDYRSWTGGAMSVPVVVGAYPKPFTSGTTSVVAAGANLSAGKAIVRQVGGTLLAKKPTRNYIVISGSFTGDHVRIKRFRQGVLLELGGAIAHRLARDPGALRYHYGVTR
jgi:hypothetical protein